MATIQAIEARSRINQVHQIQSGQVIVDLCSVAKELVENSLDAGATTIEVRFKNNGLDLIEVQDNGSGISPENYENVALKHYTSKLSSYDDLSSLHTFGFRGEAISSLCALADFHIVTAQEKQVPRANRLDFEQSGKLRKTQIVAGQKGTTASVEGIFKRLPVRRRELEKNIKREYGKVLNLLHAYACISTGVRFSVRNTVGKTRNVVVFSTNGNKTTKENIANVYGAKTLSALISLDLDLEFEPSAATKRVGDDQPSKIQVRGHISRPVFGEGRQTPDRQMFFVNSRPCGLPQIQKAFNEVYKSFNVSQSAFIFADFQMDTGAYDVNVSPDKRQILLHDAGAMIESLKGSLAQLFEDADQTVPQSSVKSKPLPKQQPLASLPGFVTARELSESGGLRSPSQDRTKESSVETPGASQQSALQRFTSSEAGMGSAQATSSPARSMRTPRTATNRSLMSTPAPSELETSTAAISDDELFVQEGAQEEPEPTALSDEPSSQPPVPDETPSRTRGDPEEIPNIVQNAFDRMLQRLIHEAEETAMLPQENSAKRAKKMSKGAAHRDATIQLVGTVDGSISRLQSQFITLQKTLQAGTKKTKEEATDLGEKTAEDKLSLTVSKNDFAQMRIIGQFNLGFIIAVRPGEDHDELFIIDQHASDEKFNFERLQAETVVQNQRLVRPQRLDLTAVEEEVVLENRVALEKNGFLVTVDESGDEPIGRRCQLVSLPLSKEVVFGVRDLEELIVLLSESISTSNELSVPRPSKVRKMFAMRACRSSIMIGKTLTSRQMERVVQNMGTIDKPWNCPHGRPTMRHLMSLGQWDEWNEFEETEGLDPWKQYLEEEEDEEEDEE
ncbi:Pc12g11630 [Penicillium rubens Wisconsin 54-1255]|uniref:DNA mismatch repair protein PMS1 n=1 Tax=Penicillium rubens (strain ATCC 28089 / DSM 1075 / NRRL 1951 / Wisconsin 54-1255) TaxID=500485 RepID=B6GXP2_PENRW|nr:Pc12g11630 [Penicillium rubens Wisconsin 54-1255]